MSHSSKSAKSIFLEAIEKHRPEQWPAFLDVACGGDVDLRGRVEQLLRARSAMGSFHEAGEPTIDQPMREGPGTVIGRYKLLQQIGEGGMGTVYMAEQIESVQRKVALKIIKPGMDSDQVIARFEAERQALAMMDHVNIARVLDVGATVAGRPYFVMELVHGVSITKYCDDNRLTPRERLELVVPVCQAIHHAHQKGIIHRDIKPSNVMITLCDGKPVPKVIDFGVAKATEQRLTERTLFTQYGAMVGTPEYMSPEQAEMSALGVDTRSDIYSLGVLLFELLTGSTPLINKRVREAGFSEILRMIKEEEPPKPSHRLSDSGAALASISAQRQTEPAKLALLLRGEVDWIVMKCLEKDRTRRYESAAALALDLQRYLADEPVEACPPSAIYRLRKLARKHKAALGITSVCVLLLLIGVIVSTWQALVTAAAFVFVLFVAAVVSAWLAVRAMLAEGREREAARQMQIERDHAQVALTRQVAHRLDAEMRQLAAVGHSIEATLAQREDWQESQLTGWLTDLLNKDDRIHGLTLAFEPFQFDKSQEEFCLYVWHSPDGIRPKRLLSPEYRYREWDWYKKPIEQQRPLWIGPFMDTGGGDVPLLAYSVPLRQRGRCVGAMTVDLPVEYFKRLWSWLAELNLGKHSYGFVISGNGLFINHPKFQMPCNITELENVDPEFAALARRMLKGETGRGVAVDPSTGKRAAFLFAPVASAGWSFVAVIEE